MRIFNIGIIGYGGFGKFLHNAWNHQDYQTDSSVFILKPINRSGIRPALSQTHE
jgi:hypothetical protein